MKSCFPAASTVLLGLFLVSVFFFSHPARVVAWTNGEDAQTVLGQADFTSNSSGTTAANMKYPIDVAVDPATGKVFIADYSNNRVLRFSSAAAASNGSDAEAVFGQADFTSGQPNRGLPAAAANTIFAPVGVFVDTAGRLWVSDRQNSRILRFDDAATKTSGADADGVLGQADFTGKSANRGAAGPSANTLNIPGDLYVDASGRLWIADEYNCRVLRYNNAASKANGSNADGVLGQNNFTSSGGNLTQNGMDWPRGIYGDASGVIFVADYKNRRVLRFDNAAAKANGANADGVLGQADFTSSVSQTTAAGVSSAEFVAMDTASRLYVADRNNNRILIFYNAAGKANGAAADNVLGQADFTSGLANRGGAVAANTLNGPMGSYFESRAMVADFSNNRVLGFGIMATPWDPVNDYTVNVTPDGLGTGTVTSSPAGINCPGICGADFSRDSTVTLNAAPDAGFAFEGWSGADCPGNGDCTLTMNQDHDVTATFNSDLDGDGISDNVELAGPNAGDGDGNGSVDSNEDHVATFKDIYGNWVTLVSEPGTRLRLCSSLVNPSPGDAPDKKTFGAGFFGFTVEGVVEGETTTVILILHDGKRVLSYYKYGPTPDQPVSAWYEFLFDGRTGATITQENGKTRITLQFRDGSRGDDDLTANGTITDIGGPSTSTATFNGESGKGCFISQLTAKEGDAGE